MSVLSRSFLFLRGASMACFGGQWPRSET